MAMPEVFFVNVNLREGINTEQITSARRKLVSSTDFSLFNLLVKVNVCLCNCVTPCTVLCNILFLSRSNLVLQFFASCVTLCFVCVTLFLHLTRSFLLIMLHSVVFFLVYRSVFTADHRPAERAMAHAYSVVQESVQFPSM